MDTSKEYIEKCDCPEIQGDGVDDGSLGGTFIGGHILYHIAPMNQPHNRDGYYHVTDTEAVRKCDSCGNEESYIESTKYIWLPRQDQLQEMVFQLGEPPTAYIVLLREFMQRNSPYYVMFASMEQLWLAFVMKEKFNKTWDGEKWLV